MEDFVSGPTSILPREGGFRVRAVELAVVEGPDRGTRVRVESGTARIGSAKGNDLVLLDQAVSRIHCEIAARGDAVTLLDRGSTNGTWIDGRRVRDGDITHGTIVRVGGSAFQVSFDETDQPIALSERTSFGDLIGASPEMRRVYAVLEKAALTDSTVLITGETGTGKDVAARAIHEASRRADEPFVALDCGAIAEPLIESELFGHVRGAFTGAVVDRRGAFEDAHGGTIFFDEIGELPLTLQPKLLRALESRQVRAVGGNQAKKIDVRVVAATNRPLARSINQGTFREDLYYRLGVIEVEMPPLRARREDVPALAAHFVERFAGHAEPIPPVVLSSMMTRDWLGNVRELRNFVERGVSLGWSHAAAQPSARRAGHEATVPVNLPLKDARAAWTEQFESVYVRALLEKTGGNVTRAAQVAGVTRRFFQRTMARVGVKSTDVSDRDD